MAPHKVINISGLNPVDDPEYVSEAPRIFT